MGLKDISSFSSSSSSSLFFLPFVKYLNFWFVVAHSLSCVQLFVIPWTAAHQASLSCTMSQSLLKLMSIFFSHQCHPTILSSVVWFSCLQSFSASGSFPMSRFFASGGQSIEVSASASVLPMNIQDWFPLGLTGLISLQSKRLSRVFSNTTVQKHQLFGAQSFMVQLSYPCMTTGKTIALTIWTFMSKVMSLFFNMLSSFALIFSQGASIF